MREKSDLVMDRKTIVIIHPRGTIILTLALSKLLFYILGKTLIHFLTVREFRRV